MKMNEKWLNTFSLERFRTKTRFDSEARENSEMDYKWYEIVNSLVQSYFLSASQYADY